MQTLQISYRNHQGAKAIYLENNHGDHFIVCPLELTNLLRNIGKDNSLKHLNLCHLSHEGNLIDDTVMDLHFEGVMAVINIRNCHEPMISQYMLPRQEFISMAQTALQVLALTKIGTRRGENAYAMAI